MRRHFPPGELVLFKHLVSAELLKSNYKRMVLKHRFTKIENICHSILKHWLPLEVSKLTSVPLSLPISPSPLLKFPNYI